MPSGNILVSFFVVFVMAQGAMLNWNILFNGRHHLSPAVEFKEYAESKLQSLRNLRSKIYKGKEGNNSSLTTRRDSWTNSSQGTNQLILKTKRNDEGLGVGGLLKNLETFLSFTAPIKKMLSSKQGIESLATMVLPKKDVLKKLLDIKGNLEPTLKRYLTDKFNGFLTSLVPYSENIGVPPFVLNSMKIPQDFDPRWQLIKTLLNSSGGMEKFLHSLVNGEPFQRPPEIIESRSGDETDLISDQEPDATGQAYRRQQQYYLKSFNKKRLMMPGGGASTLKLMPGTRPGSSTSIDYDSVVDQNGQYGQVTYEVSLPEGLDGETFYSAGDMDMSMSASGGRGHGHGQYGGHGHGQASYGGFLDPFTILGGLAFLTYLGLMLQNSLNRNGTGGVGRNLAWDNRIPVVPINLRPIKTHNPYQVNTHHHHRSERALDTPKSKLTVENVVQDLNGMWKQLHVIENELPDIIKLTCKRYKLCMAIFKLKEMNLEFLLDLKNFFRDKDERFMNQLNVGSGLHQLCHRDIFKGCKLKPTY